MKKVCVIVLGDEKQFKEYKLFKGDLEEHAKGQLDLEDMKTINNSECATDAGQKLKIFLEKRDAVIVVCSEKMKRIIEQKEVVNIKMYGKMQELDGGVLNACFSEMSIQKKVVLVSLDEDDKDDVKSRVPHMLRDCHHFNTNDDDVLDQVISSIMPM